VKTLLTLAELASHTCLPQEFLADLGVSERRGFIFILHRPVDGQSAPRSRRRTAKVASEGSKWFLGEGKPVLYGAPNTPAPEVTILDGSPQRITRPLCIVGEHAYAAAWIWTQTISGDRPTSDPVQALAIIRDDGTVFTDVAIAEAQPLANLDALVELSEVPASSLWSGKAVKRFVSGHRPDPSDAFQRVADVVDQFIDFHRSLARQSTMTRLIAAFVLATYLVGCVRCIRIPVDRRRKGVRQKPVAPDHFRAGLPGSVCPRRGQLRGVTGPGRVWRLPGVR
jgi:hypothetical protein